MVALAPQTHTDTFPVETGVGNYFIANYPPFSTWKTDGTGELEAALDRREPAESFSLYVHLPFCQRRCRYCYFRVHPSPRLDTVDRYLDALQEELSLYLQRPALRGRAIRSVYFGGGSPSILSVEQMRRLLGGLQARSGWEAVEECTFECEPGTVSVEKLRALKELGVTRICLGFQTLTRRAIEESGRYSGPAECLNAYDSARRAGFEEINLDLIAGLPGETRESWLETIDRIVALGPGCVTIYQMELAWNSVLRAETRSAGGGVSPRPLVRRSRLAEASPLPRWPDKRLWVGEAFRRLEAAGYTIGSGYMAIRHPERWRFVYTVESFWRGADLLALGESAFGHLQGVHYQNSDLLPEYLARVKLGLLPVRRELRPSAEERLRREVILLLKTGALDLDYFRRKYGVELREKFREELTDLERSGWLEPDPGSIRLTRQGLLRVDWLLPRFYLPEHRGVRYT